MANTIKATGQTIEISNIDSDFMMRSTIYVRSVVFIPGRSYDCVDITENSQHEKDPIKIRLHCKNGDAKCFEFNQQLQLGFTFANGTFSNGAKVIFNIGGDE